VGNFCSIAAGVMAIILNDHHTEWISTYPFLKALGWSAPNPVRRQNPHIKIGNDVWIGQNAVLLEGTDIRDGSVIGSYSVVVGEIPEYSVAVGNPAKVVKERFPRYYINALLEIEWWNWPDEKIKEYAPLLCSSDINGFLAKVKEDS